MNHWLLKTEPDDYSWDDLVRENRAVWDGVSNALALKHLRTVEAGDLALIYHTGSVKAAVGVATVVGKPYPDPAEDDPRRVVIDLKPKHSLARPVTLAQMKADPVFAGWDLLRIGRLSVVPVPVKLWKHIESLARG